MLNFSLFLITVFRQCLVNYDHTSKKVSMFGALYQGNGESHSRQISLKVCKNTSIQHLLMLYAGPHSAREMPQEVLFSQKVCIFGEEAYFPTATKLNKGDSPLLLCFDYSKENIFSRKYYIWYSYLLL